MSTTTLLAKRSVKPTKRFIEILARKLIIVNETAFSERVYSEESGLKLVSQKASWDAVHQGTSGFKC